MNIANEKWETIAEFPNYMISTESRVLNKRTLKFISIVYLQANKCRGVRLWKNNSSRLIPIYRLKAIAFIANPLNKGEVNHLDGDRMNEDISNLEWCTRSENMIHAVKNGFCGGQFKGGLEHPKNVLSEEDVMLLRRWYKSGFYTGNKLGKVFGVHWTYAAKVARGKEGLYV